MIKLCYKEYPFKISLAACKAFFDATGKDLQCILLMYLQACKDSMDIENLVDRMTFYHKVCDFQTASYAIYCLAQTENKSIPLAEIQDGMFRVSFLPSDRSDELSEPWPLVMTDIATQVYDYFSENMPVKKKDIKD